MAALILKIQNAEREPLDDTIDVDVTDPQTGIVTNRINDVSGKKQLRITKLNPGRTYKVRVFPKRYRPIAQFVNTAQTDGDVAEVTVFCPVLPERVLEPPDFPDYKDLPAALKSVLETSAIEGDTTGLSGRALFESLGSRQRAGLLNLFCKMSGTPIDSGTAWDFVTDVYRVRGDRIFANVTIDFRDKVKTAVGGGQFHAVDQSLHKPGPGFVAAGSWKTDDRYGNLQLTFFSSIDLPLRFQLDADIDDAAGIEHVFQVIGNIFKKDGTDPYDIHEILTFFQGLDVNYSLPV
jgi:hypothetical protein